MANDVAIVAVDPGATCGIAFYHNGRFETMQLPKREALGFIHGVVEGLADAGIRPALVVERFTVGRGPRRPMSPQLDAQEVIGALYDLSTLLLLDFWRQNVADAKMVGSDASLSRIGWYRSGWPHANDAARHIYLTLMRHYPAEFKRVVRGETQDINRIIEESEELRNRANGAAASGQG